jgi:hypothetical protein
VGNLDRWRRRNGLSLPRPGWPGLLHQTLGWYAGLSNASAALLHVTGLLFVVATSFYLLGFGVLVAGGLAPSPAPKLPAPLQLLPTLESDEELVPIPIATSRLLPTLPPLPPLPPVVVRPPVPPTEVPPPSPTPAPSDTPITPSPTASAPTGASATPTRPPTTPTRAVQTTITAPSSPIRTPGATPSVPASPTPIPFVATAFIPSPTVLLPGSPTALGG